MSFPNIKIPCHSTLCLQDNEVVHLITDLHLLCSDNIDSLCAWTETFQNSDHLIIMGDLFEVWYENHWGAHPPYSKLFSLLGSLRKKLRSTHLIIGNREVLAGPVLEQKSGLTLHWGPLLLSAPSGNLLLMHGDELLPQDRSYQNFRQILRSPFTKFIIRLLPGPIIKALCGSARNRSRSKTPTQITHLPTVSAIWHHVKHIKPWSHHLLAGHFHKPISCEEKAGDQKLQISILSETTHRLRATGTWTNGRLKFDHQQT